MMEHKTRPEVVQVGLCSLPKLNSLQSHDPVPLGVSGSAEFLQHPGSRAVTACLFVSLPVLPASVQERNASLLLGLQAFDVCFQMEAEEARHAEKTNPNFCNLQERCLRRIEAYSCMLAACSATAPSLQTSKQTNPIKNCASLKFARIFW